MSWKARKDPLFRGDQKIGVSAPDPRAEDSIVRHVLYLGGAGRNTPYVSTSENREIAARFARGGAVYRSLVPNWKKRQVTHWSQRELKTLLRGGGKGRAKWHSAFEVAQARRYVEENLEHLADFSAVDPVDAKQTADSIFKRD